MASEEDKFKAAVNIIRSMPKDGPFQPSPQLMLRFYAFYKQATEGPCNDPKPGFWEVVKKAKWEAWRKLGNMPREEAMTSYVDELKKIVETMSYTENVANFMHVLGPFYEAVYDGQEPSNLRVASTSGQLEVDKDQPEDESGYSSSINGTGAEENESGDLDLEKPPVTAVSSKLGSNSDSNSSPASAIVVGVSPASSLVSLYSSDKFYSDTESGDEEYMDPLPFYRNEQKVSSKMESTDDQILKAVQRLQSDIQLINNRLDVLERHKCNTTAVNGIKTEVKRNSVEQVGSFAATYGSLPQVVPLQLPEWFPLKNMNVSTILFILSWPFITQLIMYRLRNRRRLL